MENPVDQRQLWENQHLLRESESRNLENMPNDFAKKCLHLVPDEGSLLEVGVANGRDARYFAREKRCRVTAIDFSKNALSQLYEASLRDNTTDLITSVQADMKHIPEFPVDSFDAFYARSAIHLSDEELEVFFNKILPSLRVGAYLMIEGKTTEDGKLARSTEIASNLCEDTDGHIRRLWSEESIRDLVDKYKLHLQEITTTVEYWNGQETRFINFIAQKKHD
ncbi:MAG TPA: class I SAM-dependent methyltransferase [Candidatus Paceibacterota bacterium]